MAGWLLGQELYQYTHAEYEGQGRVAFELFNSSYAIVWIPFAGHHTSLRPLLAAYPSSGSPPSRVEHDLCLPQLRSEGTRGGKPPPLSPGDDGGTNTGTVQNARFGNVARDTVNKQSSWTAALASGSRQDA